MPNNRLSSGDDLADGVYEHLVTNALDTRLVVVEPALVRREGLEAGDAHEVLTRHIAALTRRALREAGGATEAEKVAKQVERANRIAGAIAEIAPESVDPEDLVAASRDLLLAIARPPVAPAAPIFPLRPSVPFSESALLVNGRGQPRIGHEVKHELDSADSVDLLCAFIKTRGLLLVEDQIRELTDGAADCG